MNIGTHFYFGFRRLAKYFIHLFICPQVDDDEEQLEGEYEIPGICTESMFFWFRPKMTKDEATKQLGIKKINGDFFLVTGSKGLTLVRWDAATMKTKLASVMQVVPLRF